MNLASALIKRVLELKDYDTWMNVRKHYLPSEYHRLFDIITEHSDKYYVLPTVEELELGVRDSATLDKLYALKDIETEAEPFLLLDYLKNEFAQREVLFQLDKWIDNSVAFESAEDVVQHLQQITIDLEAKVELTPANESMQKINLFDSEEEMEGRVTLGLNADFDSKFQFRDTDYFMMGGRRGSGKSIVCSNISDHIISNSKKVLYFSIEMEARELLQRGCAIATGVPFSKIRNKDLNITEWEKVVKWWASRYQDSEADVKAYYDHRDFSKFHASISRKDMTDAYLDIIYDPALTLGKIRAEAEKRKREGNLGLIVIDYINKVKRVAAFSSTDHLDWKEQLAMSHAFKQISSELHVPVFSPYQTDASGEARMAKGILDSCDGAFILNAHKKKDAAMTVTCTKLRSADDEEEFTSVVDWNSLKIGPANAENPLHKKEEPDISSGKATGENIYDDSVF